MSEYNRQEAEVGLYIIKHGLAQNYRSLIAEEKRAILDDVRVLLDKGHDPQDLKDAARWGMSQIWPFTDGQPWDSKDFRENITKAKSAASKMRRAGRIPKKARDLKRGGGGA